MRSTTGKMTRRPGSSIPLNLPKRSTTQALCCGTMRTPSITNATISAAMANGIVYGRIGSQLATRTVATATATILKSMLPPRERESSSAACARSGAPGLGDLERIAIDCRDVENLAGLARRVARDLRVPECIPVLHPRVAGGLVDPRFECGGLPDVQALHALGHHRLP